MNLGVRDDPTAWPVNSPRANVSTSLKGSNRSTATHLLLDTSARHPGGQPITVHYIFSTHQR